jgi:RES domain-containing protein
MAARRARDSELLDAVEALPFGPFEGTAWRVVRDGRDPLICSAVGGRWDDRTFEVLYTSTRGDGAIGEMFFHIGQGQPVIPSLVKYRLYELRLTLAACVSIVTLERLAMLGLKTSTFGRLSYVDREQEYPRTQEVAEAAYFHGRDGILVPSARSEHPNLVVFCRIGGPAAVDVVKDHGLIDWETWKRAPLGY